MAEGIRIPVPAGADLMQPYPLKLPQFEGPLDLLLHLIRKNELDIRNLPLLDICRQYHEYLVLMQELDLEVAAEFLYVEVMLVHIKSQMVLPRATPNTPEEDPRDELVRRLLEYRKYKGVADSRLGMMAHAAFLVRAGYTVLAPDCRGHGSSGGDIITYGIREADDVHRWADLLLRRPGIHRLYGIGQSMGASILLESLPREPRFRAVVADCPFATFEEVAYDRLEQRGMLGTAVSWPVVQIGFLYTRMRYGLNLRDASPAAAVRFTKVPVLLIHGMKDANIPPRHSRELHALNPATTQLWEVPGADHVASLGAAPQQYQHIVIAWFEQ